VFLEEILETYQRYDLRGVREGDWKYLVHHRGRGDRMETLLFDVARDPAERNNLVESEAAIVERLSERLAEHTRVTTERAPRPGRMEPDEEHLERLRALGYLD
jgi:arylsulfatase A-like enzyme